MYSEAQIRDLLDDLRREHFRIGVGQHVQVHNLLLALSVRGCLPKPGALASFLAPLLCKSPEEMARFPALVQPWLKRHQTAWEDVRVGSAGSMEVGKPQTPPPNVLWKRWGVFVIFAVIVASITLAWLYQQSQAVSQTTFPPISTSESPDQNLDNSNATTNQTPDSNSKNPPKNAVGASARPRADPKPDVPKLDPDAQIRLRPAIRTIDRIRPWVFGAMLGSWLLWALVLYLPPWLMRRRFGDLPAGLRDIPIHTDRESLLTWLRQRALQLSVDQAARLGQHKPGLGQTLDVPATIRATARQAGILQVQRRQIKERPGYLMLMEQNHPQDQQLHWFKHWLTEFRRRGLEVEVYYYAGDPRNCWRPGSQTLLSLTRLATLHGGDRLLLFGDGAALFDILGSRCQPWVKGGELEAWPERILLTPVELGHWGVRENQLSQAGFTVLPASDQGLVALVQWLENGNARLAVRGRAVPFPPLLQDGGAAFCSDQPPDSREVVDQLIVQLRAYLGQQGFRWLAACAVYPLLRWELALELAHHLPGNKDAAPQLQRLSRLPWFRCGVIPDWLRLRLLAELSPDLEKQVRNAAEALLHTPVTDDLSLALSLPVSSATPAAHSEAGLRGDYVAVGFLGGLSASQLSLRAPQAWRNLLPRPPGGLLGRLRAWIAALSYRNGLPVWGRAPWMSVFTLLWIGGSLACFINLGSVGVPESLPDELRLALYQQNGAAYDLKSESGSGFNTVVFSTDGHRLVSGNEDGKVYLWHQGSGRLMLKPWEAHKGSVLGLALSQDGHRLATGGEDKLIRLWDADDGKPIGDPWSGHSGAVLTLAFSPSGEQLASADYDGSVRLWDVASATSRFVLQGHVGAVHQLVYSPDGRYLISGGEDRTVRKWDASSGRLLEIWQGQTGAVNSVSISPDGRRVLSGSSDRSLRLWDAENGNAMEIPLEGYGNSAKAATFSTDGQFITTVGLGKVIRFWSAATGQVIGTLLLSRGDNIHGLAFSQDGSRVASANKNGTVQVWKIALRGDFGSDVSSLTPLANTKMPLPSPKIFWEGIVLVLVLSWAIRARSLKHRLSRITDE